MHKVLRLGRHAVTLVMQDFCNWCKQIEPHQPAKSRIALAQSYAKSANKRWENFTQLDDSTSRQIAQGILSCIKQGTVLNEQTIAI